MNKLKRLLSGWWECLCSPEVAQSVLWSSLSPVMVESLVPVFSQPMSFSGTTRTEPSFLPTEVWRQIKKNNKGMPRINFELWTSETWLPHVLVEQGFFPSTSEIKRNRKDLWRGVAELDHVVLNWADILIWRRNA